MKTLRDWGFIIDRIVEEQPKVVKEKEAKQVKLREFK